MLTTHQPVSISHRLVPLYGIHLLQDEISFFSAYLEQTDTMLILSSFLTILYFSTEKNDGRESKNVGVLRPLQGL